MKRPEGERPPWVAGRGAGGGGGAEAAAGERVEVRRSSPAAVRPQLPRAEEMTRIPAAGASRTSPPLTHPPKRNKQPPRRPHAGATRGSPRGGNRAGPGERQLRQAESNRAGPGLNRAGSAVRGCWARTYLRLRGPRCLPSLAEPCLAEPSRAEPSLAEPCPAQPSPAQPAAPAPSRPAPPRAAPAPPPA